MENAKRFKAMAEEERVAAKGMEDAQTATALAELRTAEIMTKRMDGQLALQRETISGSRIRGSRMRRTSGSRPSTPPFCSSSTRRVIMAWISRSKNVRWGSRERSGMVRLNAASSS